MGFDAKFALDILLPINTSAYQFSWNQTVTLPAGWEQIATITVDKSVIDKETASGLAKIAITEDDNWGVAARKGDTAVIAIRGTDTKHQWLEDFDATAVPVSHDGRWVHHGFEEVYQTIRTSVAAAYKAVSSAPNIYVTGHSLGAALALLAGVDLKNPNTWTFAGPRVFAAGAKFDCYRIVNHWDIVPNVPVPPLYGHVGTAINVDGGFTLDAGVAHALDKGYTPGLKKLIGVAAGTT
jgi:triacylglycerol lipase